MIIKLTHSPGIEQVIADGEVGGGLLFGEVMTGYEMPVNSRHASGRCPVDSAGEGRCSRDRR